MNVFRAKSVLFGEVWFDEAPAQRPRVDAVNYSARLQPAAGVPLEEYRTRIIDLTQDEACLWQNLGRNNRYKIKRAKQKDPITYAFWNNDRVDDNLLEQFLDFHDRFSVAQGLKPKPRARARSLAETGRLGLSRVVVADGKDLTWHGHYRIEDRVIFVWGASLKDHSDTAYQSLLGRANRYHHWQDMLTYKNAGVSIYDFGGWYMGGEDQHLLNINKFKQEFGGEVVKTYRGLQGITLKGRICVKLYKMLNP